jgi:LmbE family N-acetylglucosaminyl deacetylase
MTILATGARPDCIESGGVGPLVWAAGEAHDAFVCALANGAASGSQGKRAEELERSSRLMGAIFLRIDAFADAKLTIGKEEAVQVA